MHELRFVKPGGALAVEELYERLTPSVSDHRLEHRAPPLLPASCVHRAPAADVGAVVDHNPRAQPELDGLEEVVTLRPLHPDEVALHHTLIRLRSESVGRSTLLPSTSTS